MIKDDIVYINEKEYTIIKQEPFDFTRDIGVHFDGFEIITYVTDERGRLYITNEPYYNVIFPIYNTDHVVGFNFRYNQWLNLEAFERSLMKALAGNYNQKPYYRVDVQFRHKHWYNFISPFLTFGLVYSCCKYFFDQCYPDGYSRTDISKLVDFEAGADALNYIKKRFGKKSHRKYITPAYCIRNYANKRDWRWSDKWFELYGLNPLLEDLKKDG